MSIKLKNITLPRILAFLFALYPCLNDMYINGNFKINNLILVVLVITSMTGVLKKKIDMSLEEKILGIILVISLFSTIMSMLFYRIHFPVGYWIHLISMIVLIVLYRRFYFDSLCYWRWMYIFVAMLCAILFFQEFQKIATGEFTVFVDNAQKERVASIFSEPTHYTLLATIAIISSLQKLDNLQITDRKRVIYSIVLSFSILISSSSTGLVYLLFAWGVWLIHNKNVKLKILFAIGGFATIIFLMSRGEWLKVSIEHFRDMDFRGITSGSFRVARGYAIFMEIAPFQKLIGIGSGMIGGIVNTLRIVTVYDGHENIGSNYASALSSILLHTGIIGFAVFIFMIVYIFKKSDRKGRYIVVLYFLYVFSNEIIYTPQLIIPLFLILERLKGQTIISRKGN